MTALQFVASAIGIALLLFTLQSTRRATEAAMKSAKAASDSAKAAKQAVSSERAYMCINTVHNAHREDGFYLSVEWKNYGRMPATLKGAYATCQLPDPETDIPTFNAAPFPTNDYRLGPNQEFPCGTQLIDASIRDHILKEGGFAYLFAQLEYVDVYDPKKIKIEEVTAKITRRTDWNGFVTRLKKHGINDVGCFNILPVKWTTVIRPETRKPRRK